MDNETTAVSSCHLKPLTYTDYDDGSRTGACPVCDQVCFVLSSGGNMRVTRLPESRPANDLEIFAERFETIIESGVEPMFGELES